MQFVFDVGGLDRLGTHLDALAPRRVLIVVSPRRRFVDRAVAAMDGLEVQVFDGAKVHVPVATVASGLTAVDDAGADTIVALGGGAAIGLGKALCLERALTLVAVPTTYSGSEMTDIYGTTDAGNKVTGRDDRVRPRMVIYDAALTTRLPIALTIQSLTNSLAQIVSALSTDSLEDPSEILPTVAELWHLMNALTASPEGIELRERALRAASTAGHVVAIGTMGHQHKLAHRIGGRFDLPHSTTHSILLTSFMAWVRITSPELATSLDQATHQPILEAALYDLLRSCGAPTSFGELGVEHSTLQQVLDEHPELPAQIAWDAYRGTRPR